MTNPTYNPGPGPYPTAPQPPPKKKRTGLIVLIVVGVILIALIGSCAAVINAIGNAGDDVSAILEESSSAAPAEEEEASPEEKESAPAEKKEEKEQEPFTIKASKCKRGDYGQIELKVKVTNNTERKMQYWFDIAIEDTDANTVGTGSGFIDNVKPGKTGTASVFAHMTDEEYDGKIKCVIDVTDFGEF